MDHHVRWSPGLQPPTVVQAWLVPQKIPASLERKIEEVAENQGHRQRQLPDTMNEARGKFHNI